MFDEKLEKIRVARAPFGYGMPKPATAQQLADLRAKSEALGVTLPDAYLEFLKRCNGLGEDGYVIYGSETEYDAQSGEVLAHGFAENNERWRMDDHEDEYVIFGDAHMDYFIFDKDAGTYHVIDRVSHEPVEDFASAEALLGYVLDQMLGDHD